MRRSAYRPAILGLGLAFALAGGSAVAQTAQPKASVKVPTQNSTLNDAFKGFGSNSQDPMQIEADNLDVFDNDNMAIFTGNVTAKQRDTVMKTAKLKVFYEPRQGEASKGTAPATPAPAAAQNSIGANQTVRRLEAEGKVLITQNDQSVSGDTGWFDMPSNKAQVNTNVVLVQGTGANKNIATGVRLDIDLATGLYRLNGGGGRVIMVLEPSDSKGK